MKYYLDTEFFENGHELPVMLLSIGIVAEDGREYYAELEYDDGFGEEMLSDWLKKNVVPYFTGPRKSRLQVAREIKEFVGEDRPEFWGYFADYDWLLFCQLHGGMLNMPSRWPMLCLDMMQMAIQMGIPRAMFPEQLGNKHNALDDARWHMKLHKFLESWLQTDRPGM